MSDSEESEGEVNESRGAPGELPPSSSEESSSDEEVSY